MAKSLNKVQVIGRLGKDPTLRYTASSSPVAVTTFDVATGERYKDQNDEWQESTEWHRVVAWGNLAEIAGEYLAKGRQVYIEGKLQTRSWNDKEGNKHYTTEIVARNLILLGGRDEHSQHPQHPADTIASPPMTGQEAEDAGAFNHVPVDEDDLPF